MNDVNNYRTLFLECQHVITKQEGFTAEKRVKLTEWVYKTSNRISYKMADEIVTAVLKTKDPVFFLALFAKESSFDPTTLSKTKARGLGQIMSVHVPKLIEKNIIRTTRDLFNIEENVRASEYVWDLKLRESKNNVTIALSKYLGASDKHYINKILENYFNLSQIIKE